jgi:hypothetical protein
MTSARILTFPGVLPARQQEPVSPFKHLMPARPLTPREVLHRHRMVHALGRYRLTRVSTASEYKVKSFPGSPSSNRSTNVSGPVIR